MTTSTTLRPPPAAARTLNELDELEALSYQDGVAFRELSSLLASRWKFILSIALCGGILAALIALQRPNTYTASSLVIPPSRPQSLSSMMMGQLGGVAGALAPSLGLKDPADMYIGILRSRTVNDEMIDQFGLLKVYSAKTREDARRRLTGRTAIVSGRDSMIRISVEDRSPQRAAELANAYVAELNKQNTRLAITESSQRRLFFEHEVEAEKNALADAERHLKETQQNTGVVEVTGQARVVMDYSVKLRAEMAMQQVQIHRLEMGATAANPEVARAQAQLSALRTELSKVETADGRPQSGNPLVPVANMPQAGLEYLRALREVKYHDSLFEVLAKQYEAARIDEAKEAPAIQVVDVAVAPEKKSGPNRTQMVLIGAFLAGAFAAAYVRFSKKRPPPQLSHA
jgi:tyrosine-protein kinase Etk/Wzc